MPSPRRKITPLALSQMKARGEKIVALGVYDAPMAAIAERVGFDIVMIGNSGPMSLLGYTDSPAVRAEDLFYMTKAVRRATKTALVVATMPYMSYLVSAEEAIRTAGWLVSEGGADCVQCHADQNSADTVRAIVRAGVPVLAHIGLRSVRKIEQGGFRIQGKTASEALAVVKDACALADAGAFAIVVELVPAQVTAFLRRTLDIPIISLGAGHDADGIYQVSADVVGFSVFPRPRTSAQFVDVTPLIKNAVERFSSEVQSRNYPPKSDERCMLPNEYEDLTKSLDLKG